MGCPCSARQSQQTNSNQLVRPPVPSPEDCDYTKTLIQNWFAILSCVKINKLNKIDLTVGQANMYLGYFQSALNYPDNYCFYTDKLQEFQTNVLPRIVTNVPECLN